MPPVRLYLKEDRHKRNLLSSCLLDGAKGEGLAYHEKTGVNFFPALNSYEIERFQQVPLRESGQGGSIKIPVWVAAAPHTG
jgi:hypothetical protein